MLRMVRRLLGAALMAGCTALAACQSSSGEGGATAFSGGLGTRIEAPGVPISLESIEGAPERLRDELTSALLSEASARRVEVVSASGARWRLKGYLTASQDESGRTRLSFVWDVFDKAKHRARRLEGSTLAGVGGGDAPWSAIDRAELQRLASQSMNEIAVFLATSSAGS